MPELWKIFAVNPIVADNYRINNGTVTYAGASNTQGTVNGNPNRPETRDDKHGRLLYCLV